MARAPIVQDTAPRVLLKIKSDFDLALDRGQGAALVLLDFSAAFDTVDHSKNFPHLIIAFWWRDWKATVGSRVVH